MFSGIIQKTGVIRQIQYSKNGKNIGIKNTLNLSKKDIGSSINCSGVCLTVEKIYKDLFFFYLSKETLALSNFKKIKLNAKVNLEKSLNYGTKISGHFVQGHVDDTSILLNKKTFGRSWYLYFSMNKKIKKFLVYKGSIAINGISLTLAKIYSKKFLVVVVPHTLKFTNLINIKKKDLVNIEIDILSKYMYKFSK